MPRYYRTVHATQTVTNNATTNKQSKRRTTKNSTFKEGKQKICASGGVELGDMVQKKPITSEYSSTTKSAELFDLLLSENGFHYGCQWNVIFRVQIGSQSTRTLPCRVSNRRKNKATTASRTLCRFQCCVSSAIRCLPQVHNHKIALQNLSGDWNHPTVVGIVKLLGIDNTQAS